MKTAKGWAFPEADEFMVAELKDDGTYQAPNLYAALDFVTDFSCAIDGGAHIGTWSKLLNERFQRVIAVEPSPDTFAALVTNMAAFGCAQVESRNVALGKTAGFVSMTLDEKGASMKNTGARFVQPGDEIRMVTIDSWNLPTLGFLKLDIEGSEPAALEGARATLKRCKPVVLFEHKFLWKRFGLPREACAQILKPLGYRQVATVSRDEIWAVRR